MDIRCVLGGVFVEKKVVKLVSEYDNLPLSVLLVIPEKEIRGIVQIAHGMSEHKERYLPFMGFLAEHGYACVINDHRGHGESVRSKSEWGYFYNSGSKGIVEDLHQITVWAKKQFPGKKFFLLGHSMGTLAARSYIKKYDFELNKLILTGPPCKNPAVGMGLALARIQKKIKGDHYRSKEIQAVAFGSFAGKFLGEKSKSAWICSDQDIVKTYDASELCGFTFTTDGFESLFLLMKETYSKKGWEMQKPELPVLFLGGSEDPCIGNGRKFVQEMQFLKQVGYQHVTGKCYSGMRHEILNEKGKEEVFENILTYLEKQR